MIKRMIEVILGLVLLMVGFVVLTNIYLAPDNLGQCKQPTKDWTDCRVADAIVVVSGGDTVARTDKAIAMWQAGYGRKIIFSGASASPTVEANAIVMERRARAAGIPSSVTYIDSTSRDTIENAKNSVKLLHKINARDVILVSSPYHLRRVRLNFERLDRSIAYRTVPANDTRWDHWYLRPGGWWLALSEWGGILALITGVSVK